MSGVRLFNGTGICCSLTVYFGDKGGEILLEPSRAVIFKNAPGDLTRIFVDTRSLELPILDQLPKKFLHNLELQLHGNEVVLVSQTPFHENLQSSAISDLTVTNQSSQRVTIMCLFTKEILLPDSQLHAEVVLAPGESRSISGEGQPLLSLIAYMEEEGTTATLPRMKNFQGRVFISIEADKQKIKLVGRQHDEPAQLDSDNSTDLNSALHSTVAKPTPRSNTANANPGREVSKPTTPTQKPQSSAPKTSIEQLQETRPKSAYGSHAVDDSFDDKDAAPVFYSDKPKQLPKALIFSVQNAGTETFVVVTGNEKAFQREVAPGATEDDLVASTDDIRVLCLGKEARLDYFKIQKKTIQIKSPTLEIDYDPSFGSKFFTKLFG
eukprot:c6840_g1_i1.p1 GENE.c6840_g1_i1~~c6840_g1_i1.p1  ORF type:complete len:392 (+),score=74.05 c6840_g1_i1:35-1177(+)